MRSIAAPYIVSDDKLCDLVLTVDEAANIPITHTSPSSTLGCALSTGTSTLHLLVSTKTRAPIDVDVWPFSWHLVQTTVDSLLLHQHQCTADKQWPTTITVTTRRHSRS